jgi:hypothetical protein
VVDGGVREGVVENIVDDMDPNVAKGMQEEGDVDSNVDGIAVLVPSGNSSDVVWSFAVKLLRGAVTKPGGKAGLACLSESIAGNGKCAGNFIARTGGKPGRIE